MFPLLRHLVVVFIIALLNIALLKVNTRNSDINYINQRSLRDSTILYGVYVGEMLVLKAICDALTH